MKKSLLAALLVGITGIVAVSRSARAADQAASAPEDVGSLLAWEDTQVLGACVGRQRRQRARCREGGSLFGDVYADPSRWRPLTLGNFFSEGWTQPWVSPPPGEGGAPRQGWLNAFDGVFYRLGIVTGGYAEDYRGNGNLYTGGLTLYTPLNARFELRTDVPFVVSNREASGYGYHTAFGDFQITPRFLLSEDRNTTQSFNLTFRTPTGSRRTGTACRPSNRPTSSGRTRGAGSSCGAAPVCPSRTQTSTLGPAPVSSGTWPSVTTARPTT